MAFLFLDPDRVDDLAESLRTQATAADASAYRVRSALSLAALDSAVPSRLEQRGDDWRTAATHLSGAATLARNHVVELDRFDPDEWIRRRQAGLREILDEGLPAELVGNVDACGIVLPPEGGSNIGDLGGTFDTEERTPFSVCAGNPVDQGREALIRMITDTGTPMQIGNDEFEIIQHDDNTFTIVLAGVTDLSEPDFGLNELNRTVRDTDVYAIASANDALIASNRYAQLVAEYAENHLPPGANIMIVGHSFGADTAADLAADPRFNGPDGFNVTHVVAAAYHSGPQLEHIPDTTQVLVLQNELDAAVAAEHLFHDPGIAVHEAAGAVGALLNLDPAAGGHIWNATAAGARTWWGAATQPFDAMRDSPDLVSNAWNGDYSQLVATATDLLPDLGVTTPTDSQTVAVFPGGLFGVGHHQDHYNGFLDSTQDTELLDFFASVDAAGYTENGTSTAVDVSVPDS